MKPKLNVLTVSETMKYRVSGKWLPSMKYRVSQKWLLTSGIQSNLTVPDIGKVEHTQPSIGPEAETGHLQIHQRRERRQ